MKPIDYRNATFADVQAHVAGDRATVLRALREYGPCTTRQLSKCMRWDILKVRPRVTELIQLGLAELWEPDFTACQPSGREGLYRALSEEEAIAEFRRRKSPAASHQPQLL